MRRAIVVVASSIAAVFLACVDIIGIHDVPDGAGGDAPVTGPLCDPLAPFGAATLVNGLDSVGVGAITLTPDELTAYVCKGSAQSGGTAALFEATRTARTSAFGSPTHVGDGPCAVTTSFDGLTAAWAMSDSPDAGGSHLVIDTRASTGQPFHFDAGQRLSGLNGAGAVLMSPFLRADGREIYFASAGQQTFRATSDAGFQVAIPVTELGPQTFGAIVTQDDLVVYYVGNAFGTTLATRDAADQPFGAGVAAALPDAGKGVTLVPILITPDRCTLYYQTTNQVLIDGAMELVSQLWMVTKTP